MPEPDIDKLIREYRDTYDVAPELQPGGTRHASLREAARIELGMRKFLGNGGFGAFTTNFEDLGGLRQLPGLAVQRLMADGYGFAGEGDWKTAVKLGSRFRLVANEVRVVEPARAAAETCRSRARCGSRGPTGPPPPSPG